MAKKIKIAVLAAIAILVISDITFARGGYQERGNRNYRPDYRHCDSRPIYRECRPVRARPAYVYRSSGIVITPFIVIGW